MKDYAKSFYHSEAWRKCRASYISYVGGLCEDCLADGIYTPGKVVHHIKHITPDNIGDTSITLDFGNLRLVCQDCHAKEHQNEKTERFEILPDGSIAPRISNENETPK